MSKKPPVINAELEKALTQMLKDVMEDASSTITDKCRVADRLLKLEMLRAKMDESAWGSAFADDPDDPT